MYGTTLTDIYKSVVSELEENGIEPTLENVTKRLEEMIKNSDEDICIRAAQSKGVEVPCQFPDCKCESCYVHQKKSSYER